MSNTTLASEEHHDGQVVEIRIGPPPGNILTLSLVQELLGELDRRTSNASHHLKLIVIAGQGEHFSFGSSIHEHRIDTVGTLLPRFHQLIGRVLHCDVPTVAKTSGLCLGGGFELAIACSMIFCDDKTQFGLPEIKLGVIPPVASILLPQKTAEAVACQMILTGDTFEARTLYRWGVVNDVAEAGQTDARVDRFIREHILPKSATSLRFAVRATRAEVRRQYDANIKEVEKLYLEELMKTADASEGIDAFLEKRSPDWKDA